jgi:hypothetical protein
LDFGGVGYYRYEEGECINEMGIPDFAMNLVKVQNPLVLHLHHTYYVRNTLPWDYPDACFQVLCESCHKSEHLNKTFRMYASHSLGQSQHLTPCDKCFGSGYLPEYDYHMDGVCFRCQGAGFKELMFGSDAYSTEGSIKPLFDNRAMNNTADDDLPF